MNHHFTLIRKSCQLAAKIPLEGVQIGSGGIGVGIAEMDEREMYSRPTTPPMVRRLSSDLIEAYPTPERQNFVDIFEIIFHSRIKQFKMLG